MKAGSGYQVGRGSGEKQQLGSEKKFSCVVCRRETNANSDVEHVEKGSWEDFERSDHKEMRKLKAMDMLIS